MSGQTYKDLLRPFLAALYDFDKAAARRHAADLFLPEAPVHLSHPFNTLRGQSALLEAAVLPLASCIPDLERRDMIVMSGDGWVGCMGYYVGHLQKAWMGVPPGGRPIAMRYHEFFRFEGDKVAEVQALWDIPELLMQRGVWPMVPQLGAPWRALGPATQDGLRISGDGTQARAIVAGMLDALGNNQAGVQAMRLPQYWHPKMGWYGPAGIGYCRGLKGFRAHHQIPFLNAMPDRRALVEQGHLFAEGDYVGFTAWPGMEATLSDPGWLGLPGTGGKLTLRSLDFWRVEGGLIRENWVLVDLLHVYHQLGIDVLDRVREMTGRGPEEEL